MSTSTIASTTASQPVSMDDAAFHIPPFHSFTRLSLSAHSAVFKAYRHTTPASSLLSSHNSASLSYNGVSSSQSSSSASSAYDGNTADTPLVLKFLVNHRDGHFKPVSRAALSLFSQSYELLCLLRDRGVQGIVRPYELIAVHLPLNPLPSDGSSSSVASAASPSSSSPTAAIVGSSSSATASATALASFSSSSSYSSLCLVAEYVDGFPLSTYYQQSRYSGGFPLLEFFPAASALLSAVASIHSAHVLHRDLTHNNVLYVPSSLTVRLIDFGSSQLTQINGQDSSTAFQGTLAFVSPEQTGRVNRGVDARSDLYSVGVLMYQMLTGQLPFVSEERDELELVHAIITRLPAAPVSLRPSIPSMLSAVVMKMLAKNADERYQSARGVQYDLLVVYEQLRAQHRGLPELNHTAPPPPSTSPSPAPSASSTRSDDGTPTPMSLDPSTPIYTPTTQTRTLVHSSSASSFVSAGVMRTPPTAGRSLSTVPQPVSDEQLNLPALHFPSFPLGRGDMATRLQIPNKLYGRDKEIAAIQQAADRVIKTGQSIILCVDGVAGAGKSSTIRQSCAGISGTYPNCLVASSKLDQYNRQPFGMFKQLVSEIVLDILTQPTRVLARWRTSVMKAVGSSGALMIDMFPSLQQLIGEQPPIPILPPAEAQHRQQLVFVSFLSCFCPPHRPLIMFLDDVQWADENSLQALEQLTANPDCKHVLIILAYRKEELHAHHSVVDMIDSLRQLGRLVLTVTCYPLSLVDLQQLVADTMHCSSSHAQTVASVIHQRTEGNPFFARQLLMQLHRDGLITYHTATPRSTPNTANVQKAVDGQAQQPQEVAEVKGEWRFSNIAYLSSSKLHVSHGVLDLVRQLIDRLPASTQRLLSLAACIGTTFDADTLAVVAETTRYQVLQGLREAINDDLIAMGDNPAMPAPPSPSSSQSSDSSLSASLTSSHTHSHQPQAFFAHIVYSFVHDRIQQGAYLSIPESVRSATHLHIARLLLSAEAKKERDTHEAVVMVDGRLFEIANHFVKGVEALRADGSQRDTDSNTANSIGITARQDQSSPHALPKSEPHSIATSQ